MPHICKTTTLSRAARFIGKGLPFSDYATAQQTLSEWRITGVRDRSSQVHKRSCISVIKSCKTLPAAAVAIINSVIPFERHGYYGLTFQLDTRYAQQQKIVIPGANRIDICQTEKSNHRAVGIRHYATSLSQRNPRFRRREIVTNKVTEFLEPNTQQNETRLYCSDPVSLKKSKRAYNVSPCSAEYTSFGLGMLSPFRRREILRGTNEKYKRAAHCRCMYTAAGAAVGPLLPVQKRLLVADLQRRKKRGEKISMITAYDAPSAQLLDEALIDMLLVGDSVSNVVLGLASTAQIDLETMILFAKVVNRAVRRAVVVFDFPYGSYSSAEQAVENAISVVKRTGVTTFKLEGFCPDTVKVLRDHGHVICHLGVQPQTAESMASRGRTAQEAADLLEKSLALEAAGCSILLLEKVCAEVADVITSALRIPTIGIGSGPGCDGQVLVYHDMFGLSPSLLKLKFVKKFAEVHPQISAAAAQYKSEVSRGTFPGWKNSFFMPQEEREKFYSFLAGTERLQAASGKTSELCFTGSVVDSTATQAGEELKVPKGKTLQTMSTLSVSTSRDFLSQLSKSQSTVQQWINSGLTNKGTQEATVHSFEKKREAKAEEEIQARAAQIRRICVRGGGALGQMVAWWLTGLPNVEVTILTGREDLRAAVDAQGGQIMLQRRRSLISNETSPQLAGENDCWLVEGRNVNVLVGEKEIPDGFFDAVFVCTKSRNVGEAGGFAFAKTAPGGIVVSLQNGLEAYRVLTHILNSNNENRRTVDSMAFSKALVFGSVTYSARELAPGLTRLAGDGQIRVCAATRDMHLPAAALARVLSTAGLTVSEAHSEDVLVILWEKAAVNACVNTLTAILRCPSGYIEHPALQPIRDRVLLEVVSTARARGIPLEMERSTQLLNDVARKASDSLSSMLVDVMRGRPTEVDAINGEIVRQAREVGLKVPVVECLMSLVKFTSETQEITTEGEPHCELQANPERSSIKGVPPSVRLNV